MAVYEDICLYIVVYSCIAVAAVAAHLRFTTPASLRFNTPLSQKHGEYFDALNLSELNRLNSIGCSLSSPRSQLARHSSPRSQFARLSSPVSVRPDLTSPRAQFARLSSPVSSRPSHFAGLTSPRFNFCLFDLTRGEARRGEARTATQGWRNEPGVTSQAK